MSNKNQLKLTLSKLPFDVMISGEKTLEYRNCSKWILSRILNKDGSLRVYETVRFQNGYSSNSPFFVCEYLGFYYAQRDFNLCFSNGLEVCVKKGMVIIVLGSIVEKGNIK